MTPPNPLRLRRMRAALRRSDTSGDVDFEAIEYFRLVRDPAAADLLVALLSKTEINPLLLEAVVHQNRVADAPVLEQVAAAGQLPRDAATADYARELASRLRRPDTCR